MAKTSEALMRCVGQIGAGLASALVPVIAEARTDGTVRESASPVEIGLAYTGDVWANTSGGERRGVRYLDNFGLTIDVDGDEVLGLPGISVHGHAIYNNGESISGLVGDVQGVSNIEVATRALRLFEAWTLVQVGRGGSVKFGLYDLNSEFDSIDAAGFFVNSSHGIGAEFAASGEKGPSIFPVTSLALRIEQELAPRWTARFAALDAVPGDPQHPKRTAIDISSQEGALLVGEIEHHRGETRIVAGHWYYTADQPRIDDAGNSRSHGTYALAEGRLAGSHAPDAAAMHGFVRFGFANGATNPVTRYIGAGLIWSRPFHAGAEHALGLAMAWAELGSAYRKSEGTGQREVNFELTYRQAISSRLTVQPNVQLVLSPGGRREIDDALAAGIRVSFEL